MITKKSSDPKLLQFLGRVHSADETRQALRSVRDASFDNYRLSEGLLVEDGQSLRFALRGLLLANELFIRLIARCQSTPYT